MAKKEVKDNQDPKLASSDQPSEKLPETDKTRQQHFENDLLKDMDIGRDIYDHSQTGVPSESEGKCNKRPNPGVMINRSKDPKKPKKEEKEVSFENLKALLKGTVSTSFRELDEKIIRFINEDKRIEGLEAGIHALLHEDEDKEFKNDETEPKKCFWEWQKEFDGSDIGRERLHNLKERAVDQGINLSTAIIDLMFFMSYDYYDEMLEKFRVLETTLEWIIQRGSSVVIRRVLGILRTTDIKLRNKKQSEALGDSGEDINFVDEIVASLEQLSEGLDEDDVRETDEYEAVDVETTELWEREEKKGQGRY
ncbi:conserved hypothetical protein [Ricinus communis]|uniref:Uncharacterized protein n=1 Tax=Ricinus communis TaxID=3988 RepID=B9SXM3_RICCO|nr:conserved hypothetical protein [Ricinus communis]